MTDHKVREQHKVSASDGSKRGVVALLQAAVETAHDLPEGERYDVEIEIEEVGGENGG